MNLIFWLLASTMVLIALLIILPPLLRKQAVMPNDDLDQRNINIARERLAELKVNLAAGGISQNQYDEQVAELELALSDDLKFADQIPIDSTQANKQNQGRWLAYVLLIAVPASATSLYWVLGDYQAIARVNDPAQVAQNPQTDQANANMPSPDAINKMVAKLADKLKTEPNNLEGWLMLGRSYKVLKRLPEAVDAFAHAYQLAGDKPDVLLHYAEVLALANNGDWSGKPKELVLEVLSLEPKNPGGLWFAAMAYAQQGDKKTAIKFLQNLESILPAYAPEKQEIRDIIANTEGQKGIPSPGQASKSAATANISVTVQVSLADGFKDKIKPDETVFIYAQALSGPKMPLAIIKKQAKELPLTVSLTDADSMMPAMKLSNFKQVKLLARISKSGNAMPQTSDLIGVIEQANLSDQQPHKIVINGQVK